MMPHIGPTFRKRIFFPLIAIAGVVLGLAACAPQAAPATPTSGVLLEALVTEAVQTQRASVALEDQRAATMTAAAGQPAVLQVQTSTPTISPTPEFTNTPLPTIPPVNTPTLVPATLPTRQPGDPALRLGDPDWEDTFADGSNWSEYADTRAQIEVRDGQLYFTAFEIGAGPIWTLSWPDARNFYLEVQTLSPRVCSGKDRYGVVFRAPDPSRGYRVEIACDGQFRMVEFDESGSQVTVAWTNSESMHVGTNQINRVGVWADGTTLAVYINGVAVAGFNHEGYPRGRFGLFVTAEETSDFTVAFDNVMLWSFE